jgi:chemotaxis protein CheX
MIADLDQLIGACVTDVFGTMLSMVVEPRPVTPMHPNGEPHIASSVGFSGRMTGIVYLYTSAKFGRKIASTMLGLQDSEVAGDEMVNDVMGEIANMVVGNLKSGLCDRGYSCALTIPSIVRGSHFTVEPISSTERKVYHFSCQDRPLVVEVLLRSDE